VVYRLSSAIVLELGGGVGLTSLAAALHAKTVICTGKMGVVIQTSHSFLQTSVMIYWISAAEMLTII